MVKKHIIIFGILLLASGCSNYRLGFPVDGASFSTVYVAPAVNKAFVSQAQGILTKQIREELIRNGIELGGKKSADVSLLTTITNYGRSIGAVYETDPDNAKTLSLSLNVECECVDNKSGKSYFKTNISHSISINANDYAQAIEYQKMPLLTREVAKKIAMVVFNTKD